jgi:Leucine-rich repeat (LRR) protein
MVEKPLFRLEVLHLEGNKLRDRGLGALLKALSDCDSLQELNLSKTSLGDNGAIAVGSYLKDCKQLRKLDLHWNIIRAVGGAALFQGLASNTSLRVLDISWNALCHPQDSQIGNVIAAAFRKHPNLYHVDLSHNQLSEEACAAVNRGLSENHSIAGIHMQGNDAKVDALGFVNPKEGCSVPSEAHVFVRILGESQAKGMWRPTTNCWLCEGWSEVEFLYTPSSTPRLLIYLHLSFESYTPYQLTESPDRVYREYRMCPPGEVRFFFTEGNTQKISSNYQTYKLAVPLLGPFEYSDEVKQSAYVDQVNILLVRKNNTFSDLHIERRAKPRPLVRKLNREEEKPTWSLPFSVFREYKFEDEELLYRCFELGC